MSDTVHLRPHAPVADRVLLPGDPGRALRLAQHLLVKPAMLNHNRGLWGYSGAAKDDGLPLTIQSTGMGGPSAAIVVEELVVLGARRFVRAGTCGALRDGFALGDLVAVESVEPGDGTSRALGADGDVRPAFVAEGLRRVRAVTTDVFFADVASDADVVEMEAATVLTVAARHGLPAGCVLCVSDLLAGGERRRRIEPEALMVAELELGAAAFAALRAA